MSSPSEVEQKEITLSDILSDLENSNAYNILPEELKQLYAEVQFKCNDFRNNIFFKNIDNIEEGLVRNNIINFLLQGTFDKGDIPYSSSIDENELKKIELYPELLAKFEDKAKEI